MIEFPKRHNRPMKPQGVQEEFGLQYLVDVLTGYQGRLRRTMEEVNWALDEVVEEARDRNKEEGEKVDRGCAPTALMIALGPGEVLPSEIHALANPDYFGPRTLEMAKNLDLAMVHPISSHNFVSLMEETRTHGAIILTQDERHAIGIAPQPVGERNTGTVSRFYHRLDLNAPGEESLIIDSLLLPDEYAKADLDLEEGGRAVFVLQRKAPNVW